MNAGHRLPRAAQRMSVCVRKIGGHIIKSPTSLYGTPNGLEVVQPATADFEDSFRSSILLLDVGILDNDDPISILN